jgi:hypothetical protein
MSFLTDGKISLALGALNIEQYIATSGQSAISGYYLYILHSEQTYGFFIAIWRTLETPGC